MRNHLAFQNFRPSVIAAAENLFSQKPWHLSWQEQDDVSTVFAHAVSEAYGCPSVDVRIDPWAYSFGYGYDSNGITASITMKRFGIWDLFMLVRTHVLASGGALPQGTDPSLDPAKWASSLFYRVKPVMFRARIREGRLQRSGVTARDTYTSDSWDKLVAAGLTHGDSLCASIDECRAILSVSDQTTDEEDAVAAGFDPSAVALHALSRDEVRALAVAHNIPRQGRNKAQLIDALVEAGVRS